MVTAFWWFLGFLYVIMGLFWFAMWLGYARDSRYAADTKRASRFALCAPVWLFVAIGMLMLGACQTIRYLVRTAFRS